MCKWFYLLLSEKTCCRGLESFGIKGSLVQNWNLVKDLRWNIFAEIVKSYKPLTFFAKKTIVDFRLGSKYVFVFCISRDLSRNELYCDWRLWWLVGFSKKLETFAGKCFSPRPLRGRLVSSLTVEDLSGKNWYRNWLHRNWLLPFTYLWKTFVKPIEEQCLNHLGTSLVDLKWNSINWFLYLWNIVTRPFISSFNRTKTINPFHATGLIQYLLKHQKTFGFVMFLGGIEKNRWQKMSSLKRCLLHLGIP